MGCLTYTDAQWNDVGVLQHATCDFAFGNEENSFIVGLDRRAGLTLEPFSLIYIEGTEFGGMITQCDTDTDPLVEDLKYVGLTWHGKLNTYIIEPDAGQDYLIVQGEANAILAMLVERLGIGDLYEASTENSGIQIKYQFNRYIEAYTGVRKMLGSSAAKLHMEYNTDKVVLSALPIVDHSVTDALDTDKLTLKMSKCFLPVNHLVCLGQGELRNRTVIHLYADEQGNVSDTQTLFGSMENSLVYDYANAEEDELREEGIAKLKELQQCDTSEANFLEDRDYDIDDIVGTYDAVTGEFITATISKKILTVDKYGNMNVNYGIGDTSAAQNMTGSSESSGGGKTYVAGHGITITGQTIDADVSSEDLDALSARITAVNTTASNAYTATGNLEKTKADKDHKHNASDITSGTLPVNRGGTGASDVDGIYNTLGITVSAEDINQLEGIESNVQDQLDGKAAIDHTHPADSASFLNSHPVGSLYFCTAPGDPSDEYGGTWKRCPSLGGFAWKRTE